jgi:hypothetical protein
MIVLTGTVCQICEPPKVAQKHVDGVTPTQIRRMVVEEAKVEAVQEATAFVTANPSPALKKAVKKKAAKKKAAKK